MRKSMSPITLAMDVNYHPTEDEVELKAMILVNVLLRMSQSKPPTCYHVGGLLISLIHWSSSIAKNNNYYNA